MNVAIFGLGRFGTQLAQELARIGTTVLAVDSSPEPVRHLVDEVALAAQGDVTDVDFLKSLDLDRYDSIVVAIADDVAASVLTVLTLKQQLFHRHIVAKARDNQHRRSLQLAGADDVLNPEFEAATRLAHTLGSIGVDDYMSLDGVSGIARIHAPVRAQGQPASEFELFGNMKVFLIARVREGKVTLNPDLSDRVQGGDTWIVAGNDKDLQRLRAR